MPSMRRGTSAPPKRVFRNGVEIKRIMRGTVEHWSAINPVAYDFNFLRQDELQWAPVSGFDPRTAASSPRSPGFTFNGMFVAGDNSQISYNVRLVDQQVDGLICTWEVTMGDVMNTRANPSILVLASNPSMTDMCVVEFGSNGFEFKRLLNGTASGVQTSTISLAANDVLRVTRESWSSLSFYKNGSFLTTWNISSISPLFWDNGAGVNGKMYTGFGVYSRSSTWSSRIERVKITGTSNYPNVTIASEALARIKVPLSTWSTVALMTTPRNDPSATIELSGATWNYSASTSDRMFRILVNGSEIARTPDEGGYVITQAPITAGGTVEVQAYSAATNTAYRDVTNGVLRISPGLF